MHVLDMIVPDPIWVKEENLIVRHSVCAIQ
jgi:hypothetical protein